MSRDSFVSRDEKRGNASYRRSRVQEKKLADRLGGRRTSASGSKDEKGDVRVRRLVRVEAKTTKHRSFSVTLDMVREIETAALTSDELPFILVEFINEQGKPIAELCVVPSYVLDDLIHPK